MDKFTKADLEDGMIVQLRNGIYYMYFKKFNIGVRYEGYIRIADYNDDLSDNNNCDIYDIVAVYSPKNLTSLDFASQVKYFDLIWKWKKQEEVVMTISEIEEKLGIKNLKVVSEKEKAHE